MTCAAQLPLDERQAVEDLRVGRARREAPEAAQEHAFQHAADPRVGEHARRVAQGIADAPGRLLVDLRPGDHRHGLRHREERRVGLRSRWPRPAPRGRDRIRPGHPAARDREGQKGDGGIGPGALVTDRPLRFGCRARSVAGCRGAARRDAGSPRAGHMVLGVEGRREPDRITASTHVALEDRGFARGFWPIGATACGSCGRGDMVGLLSGEPALRRLRRRSTKVG